MSSEIVLTSPTTHLRILLDNKLCSLTSSIDGSILYVETVVKLLISSLDRFQSGDNFIIRSDLSLRNSEGQEIWSASINSMGISQKERIRIDCLFGIIFSTDEPFEVFPPSILLFDKTDTRKKFELRVQMALQRQQTKVVSLSQTSRIHTEKILVGKSTIRVSREVRSLYEAVCDRIEQRLAQLLVSSSPFFENLFEGNYCEKERGIYEIKDVSEKDFMWFIESFHRRNWEFASMDRALLALTFADRFELLYLHSRVLPYLKKNILPKEDIKDTLILCSRFKRIDELISWVVNQCDNENEVILLLRECSRQISSTAMEAALKALLIMSLENDENEKRKTNLRDERIAKLLRTSCNGNDVVIQLRCHNTDNCIVYDDFFRLTIKEVDGIRGFSGNSLWRYIPKEYLLVKIDEISMRRGDERHFKASWNETTYVHAFID
ncbi:hypothetical protein PRIPAC_72782 [Pristionchus pacificus]|uniref:BTB domain-containing protein n=1 Tax=Pristionchus pacificus TaxID=54126 RepID=A0A2A6BFK4_PRIPA|nr:hypothetical protein PRIPAC_72782 [Pristionchus pacificus]|eukprot:PDM64662.1 hypothetical protein PRIPAC_52918 [Pristionchus pacificus]